MTKLSERMGQVPGWIKEEVAGMERRVEALEAKVRQGEALALSVLSNTLESDAPRRYCLWEFDADEETYTTTCGKEWEFAEGGPAENNTRFCPYCGGIIAGGMH